jgi:trk system potassium uptake protein TrkA
MFVLALSMTGAVVAAAAVSPVRPGLVPWGRLFPWFGEPFALYVGEGVNASIAVTEEANGWRNCLQVFPHGAVWRNDDAGGQGYDAVLVGRIEFAPAVRIDGGRVGRGNGYTVASPVRIIIVGGGEIGFGLAQALAESHQVFVIDHASDVADRFAQLDVQFLLGSGTSDEVLARAGIAEADVVVACTGLDEVNIVTCALAKQLGRPRTFCFVSRDDFLVDGAQEQHRLAPFGIDRVIWPEAQLAADISRIVHAPWALDAEEFADGKIQLLEYQLQPQSPVAGRQIAELHLPHGSLIVAVRRGEMFFIPRGDSVLAAGDRVVAMGTPDALGDVRLRILGDVDTSRQRITIVGGGDVGLQVAERLDAAGQVDLTIIERDRARGEMIAARLGRALVLNGDGTDLELLEAEGIGRSDVLVSVIDNDERNLLASLLGRQLGVGRVVTRVGRRANLRLFERVGVDIAISARAAAVASVHHQIEGASVRLLAVIEQGAGRILELDVPAGYAPRPLRELAPPLASIVGAIIRDNEAIVPRGNDRIEPGDRLLVFTTHAAADRVRNYFTHASSSS